MILFYCEVHEPLGMGYNCNWPMGRFGWFVPEFTMWPEYCPDCGYSDRVRSLRSSVAS